MASETKTKPTLRKAKVWEILLGNAQSMTGVTFYLLMSMAQLAANYNFGITIAVVSVFMTFGRLFDAVTDGLFGGLFDKFNPKKGKIRLFLLIGWLIESAAAIVLYAFTYQHLKGAAALGVFAIIYFIFLIGYTMNQTAGGAIPVTMVKDPTQRSLLGIVITLYSYAMPLLLMNIQSMVLLPRHNNQFDSGMLRELCLVFIGISVVPLVLTMIGLSKCDTIDNFQVGKKTEKVSFKDMFNIIKKNKNLQMYVITCATDKLAQSVSTVSYVNILMAGILIGNYQANQMISNFTQVVSILFLFIGGGFVAKAGAKKSTSVWSWISIILTAVLVGACAVIFMRNGNLAPIGKFGAAMVIFALLMLCQSGARMILTMSATVMQADLVDGWYDETGKFLPGVVAGVVSFLNKVIGSVATIIAGFMIIPLGYHGAVSPQAGDPVTTPLFLVTMFLMFGLPILGWICNVVSMHWYKLDKQTMLEVEERLETRRQEALAAKGEAEA